MKLLESILIKTIIYALIPILMFFLFWWGASALYILRIIDFSEIHIIISSLLGPIIGLILVFRFHQIIYVRFYKLETLYIILIYLFCSAIAFALLMGLPFLNLFIGILAGIYLGRKAKNNCLDEKQFMKNSTKALLFIASITSIFALLIGILSLQEDFVVEILSSIFGFINLEISGPFGFVLATVYSLLLFTLQYYLAKKSSRIAYNI